MNFKVQQHQLFQLKGRVSSMKVLIAGLLFANVVLALSMVYLSLHQRIEVTPFSSSPKYANSMLSVDSEYLKLISENFIFLRLNTTPETIGVMHQQLLSFVSSDTYPLFVKKLEKEAKIIRQQKISSHFDIQHIHVNSQKLQCHIQGILHRSVGIRDLPVEKASFVLQFQYRFGRLKLQKFIKENIRENA